MNRTEPYQLQMCEGPESNLGMLSILQTLTSLCESSSLGVHGGRRDFAGRGCPVSAKYSLSAPPIRKLEIVV